MPSWCCTRSRGVGRIECRQGGGAQFIYWQLKTKKRALASYASKHNTRERAPRHADSRSKEGGSVPRAMRVQWARACNLARVRVPSLQQRTHALATCTRSFVPWPPRPKWTGTCTHGFWCGAGTAWSEVITLLTVMMFNLKGWWSTCTSCAGQDGTGPVSENAVAFSIWDFAKLAIA